MAKSDVKDDYEDPYEAGLDRFKQAPFQKGDMKAGHMIEESSFTIRFPKNREEYLRDNWDARVKPVMKEAGVMTRLDFREGTMSVSTTRKTWDPFFIIKARDFLKLIARSVDIDHALKIFDDNTYYDVLDIYKMCTGDDAAFTKRRQRLIGPDGATLKAIETLTGCYLMIQGKTICVIGPAGGIKEVGGLIAECMKNVHPTFKVQELMIKHELKSDEKMADQDWERFYPKLEKSHTGRSKTKREKKKEYNPFPEPQQPSKMDLEIESGEYFLVGAGKRKADAVQEAQKRRRDREKEGKRARKDREGETEEERAARKVAKKEKREKREKKEKEGKKPREE